MLKKVMCLLLGGLGALILGTVILIAAVETNSHSKILKFASIGFLGLGIALTDAGRAKFSDSFGRDDASLKIVSWLTFVLAVGVMLRWWCV